MTEAMVQSAEAFAAAVLGMFNAMGAAFPYRCAVALRVVAASAVWGDIDRDEYQKACLEWFDRYKKSKDDHEESMRTGLN